MNTAKFQFYTMPQEVYDFPFNNNNNNNNNNNQLYLTRVTRDSTSTE